MALVDSSQHSTLKPNSTSTLLLFYRGYETRIKGDLFNYELRGQPSLEDSKLTIVNRIIHVMFLKIASWVAGNVVTLFRSDLGSKAAIFPDIRPVFVSDLLVISRPVLAPVSVVRCRLQTRAEHLVGKNILICNNSFYLSMFRFETSEI